jgi:hypothetical protein
MVRQGVPGVERGRPRVRGALVVAVIVLIPLALQAVWDQVEASLLARAVRDLERRGEPINLKPLRATLPAADERKAARLYAAAADLALAVARDNPDQYLHRPSLVIESVLGSSALDARLDDLQREYADSGTALDLLDRATPLRFAGFGDHAPELLTNGSGMVELSAFNSIRAQIAAARGQAEAAVAAVAASVRLQRTMPNAFYEQLATASTFDALRAVLSSNVLTTGALDTLRRAYEDTPDHDRAEADLLMGRARLVGDFWPYSPEMTPWELRMQPPIRSGLAGAIGFVAARPWITHQFRRMLPGFDEALAVARLPWPSKLDAANALSRKYSIDPVRKIFPETSFIWSLGRFHTYLGPANLEWNLPDAGLILARRRVALATLGVERYRRDHGEALPATLDRLVPAYLPEIPIDPFSGGPIAFASHSGSYTIYSVDTDRKDDGGALYGAYTGSPVRASNKGSRDLGIRVPLTPATRGGQ